MKLLIYLAFVVACTSAGTIPSLASDLAEFKALVPTDRIDEIVGEYWLLDSEFRKTMEFLTSDEFRGYWERAINAPEFYAILKFIAYSGVDAVESVNKVATSLNFALYAGTVPEVSQRTTMDFFASMINALPKDKINALVHEKLETSPEFKYFYERMTSSAFDTLILNFLTAPELTDVWEALADNGYYPLAILSLFKGIFGL